MCVRDGKVKLCRHNRGNMRHACVLTCIHKHGNNAVDVLPSHTNTQRKKKAISAEEEQQLGKCHGYQVLQRDNNDI